LLGAGARENRFPIVLYADDDPAFGHGFVSSFVESADVGFAIVDPFALAYGLFGSFFCSSLRINRQTMTHSKEPTKAEIRS